MGVSEDGYEKFTHLHAVFLASSIVTYLADLTLDVILAFTYLFDGYYAYAFVTAVLVLLPTAVVQVFSVRWHVMDEVFDRGVAAVHALLLGLLHRYLSVISLGVEAMRSGHAVDYQRFHQQQSDVCMLRLFDSFLESAPQLVFHLYVMMRRKQEWTAGQAAWTALSALASMVSLGWGIAAYSSAMRMARAEKGKMTWAGMVLQTAWRFGMLSARIVALVLLALTVHEWIVIVLFVHWLVMTAWVVWQDTDFCANQWEERLYNAVVGVVYCFCFFNLKEGRSRYRAALFYVVVIAENLAFVTAFACYSDFQDPLARQNVAIASFTFVTAGTSLGLISMVLYYRFFHPVGPIDPCAALCYGDQEKEVEPVDDEKEDKRGDSPSRGPDFQVDEECGSPASAIDLSDHRTPPRRPPRRRAVQYSRSFKDSCPGPNRQTPRRVRKKEERKEAGSPSVASNVSPKSVATMTVAVAGTASADRLDSAYGTDSNSNSTRANSRSTTGESGGGAATVADRSGSSSLANRSAGSNSSQAFNNETYMSIEGASPEAEETPALGRRRERSTHDATTSDFSQCSADSRITVINKRELLYATPRKKTERSAEAASSPEKPLKRSPIVKDVTKPKEEIGPKGLTGPLTIIIPNISHQAFARNNSAASVGGGAGNSTSRHNGSGRSMSGGGLNSSSSRGSGRIMVHDYENLALVNINRARSGAGGAISHWRTYSDMAGNKHDESTAYEKKKVSAAAEKGNSDYSNYSSLQYYDIYPLSREMKEKLYRSLTPVSTTATVASDTNTVVSDSDTYEPIETYSLQQNEQQQQSGSSSSSLPVTLIHHDGRNMTTRQVVSLENLKSVLQNHETVPMDDPQDRGDLYLLAPMRLLTPIIEEPEHDASRQTEASSIYSSRPVTGQQQLYSFREPLQKHMDLPQQQQQQQQLSRSILTVISEILNGSYGPHGTPDRSENNQTAVRVANDSTGQFDNSNNSFSFGPSRGTVVAGGTVPTAAAATSSLVHTIDELRNNSLCNLFFSPSFTDASGSSSGNGDVNSTSNNAPAPQVPPRNGRLGSSGSVVSAGSVAMQSADEVFVEVAREIAPKSSVAVSTDTAVVDKKPSSINAAIIPPPFAREKASNVSVRSIGSNTLVPSPSSQRRLSLSPQRAKSEEGKKRRPESVEEEETEEEKPALPARRNSTSLLSTRAGSRKNIVELSAGAGGEADILNTPRRPAKAPAQQRLSLVAPVPVHPHQLPATAASLSQPTTPTNLRRDLPPPLLPPSVPVPLSSAPPAPDDHGLPLAPSSSPFVPLSLSRHSRSHHELSMSLSPSSKYETPTPPLRPNQFVRSCNAIRLPRRKFSVLRQRFEEVPLQQQMHRQQQQQRHFTPLSASSSDIYQNVSSGDLLHNDLSEISNKSTAATSFLDSRRFDLQPVVRADDKYEETDLQRRRRSGWATSSTRFREVALDEEVDKRRRKRASISAMGNNGAEEEDIENRPPPPLPGPKPKKHSRLPLQSAFSPASALSPKQASAIASAASSSSSSSMTTPPPSSSWSPHLAGASHRRLTGSLSPRAKIFDAAGRRRAREGSVPPLKNS